VRQLFGGGAGSRTRARRHFENHKATAEKGFHCIFTGMTPCRNCAHPVTTAFCPQCGQSSVFVRFSLKQFLFHNLLNGVFGLDKGFLYTTRMLFTQPGHSIRGYIEGRRVQHFHYFTFIVIILTFAHWLAGLAGVALIDTTHYFSAKETFISDFEQFSSANPKLFAFVRIPFLALFSMLVFRKAALNLTEHLVLNTYKVSAELLIALVFTLGAALLKQVIQPETAAGVVTAVLLVYSFWFYRQYFSVYGYSRTGLFVRSLLASALLMLITSAVTTFVMGMKDGFEK
jgi:hypothetical protein